MLKQRAKLMSKCNKRMSAQNPIQKY